MRRVVFIFICCIGMVGFGLLIHWGTHSFSEEAVTGYGLGVMSTLILYFLAARIERRERNQRDRA